ncbi:hypothetical protein CCACVL1_07205 [Corchorus capsularis]|uniref:Uncharacterized protein n=1 Tax=Corchorus capsularis TaxID=210143 RepID=A0A1R3J8P6_COCAP|nr:hypothetical protein CCACVL1_07205 [Corchorus capsularis]
MAEDEDQGSQRSLHALFNTRVFHSLKDA